jgi:hypothetical protein
MFLSPHVSRQGRGGLGRRVAGCSARLRMLLVCRRLTALIRAGNLVLGVSRRGRAWSATSLARRAPGCSRRLKEVLHACDR